VNGPLFVWNVGLELISARKFSCPLTGLQEKKEQELGL
jgi:hypothetical protein